MTNLDIFVVLLLQCFQVLGDIRHDGRATRDVVNGPMTVCVEEETLPALVDSGGDGHLKLSQHLPRVGAGHEVVVKQDALKVVALCYENSKMFSV